MLAICIVQVLADIGPVLADDTVPVIADLLPMLALQDTAVRGEGLQLSSSRHMDLDLDSDLDPLDPRFLARIHDPHPK